MTYSVTTSTAPQSATLRIVGDLDYQTADHLVDMATQLLDQTDLLDLHLDFSNLAFLDSAALSGLLLLRRRTEEIGTALHLDDRPAFLDRVLEVTGLLSHFDLTDAASGDSDQLGQTGSGEIC